MRSILQSGALVVAVLFASQSWAASGSVVVTGPETPFNTLANTCGPSLSVAGLNVDIDVPAGTSATFSITAAGFGGYTSLPGQTFDAALNASSTWGMAWPTLWGIDVPPGTLVTATLYTYAGPNLTGAVIYSSAITWNCSTGAQVGPIVNLDLAAPVVTGAVSRKLHDAAGTFDLPLASNAANPTTEPRSGGAGNAHTVVFAFDKPVVGGAAVVAAGTAVAGTPTFAGNEMSVPLTGVTNAQYVTVTVSDVASAAGGSGGGGSVRVGFLAGDVTGSRNVTLSDLLSVNAVLAQAVTIANYLRDVNVSGTLTLADKLFVNGRLTQTLPTP